MTESVESNAKLQKEAKRYREVLSHFRPGIPYSELDKMVRDYLAASNEWTTRMGYERDIHVRWKEYQDKLDQHFTELKRLSEDLPVGPGDIAGSSEYDNKLKAFLDRCEEFLKQYPDCAQQNQVAQWQQEAVRNRSYLPFYVRVGELEKQWEEMGRNEVSSEELKAFLEKVQEAMQSPILQEETPLWVKERCERLKDLQARVQGASEQYAKFDSEYQKLQEKLKEEKNSEKALEMIVQFQRAYPGHEYPQRHSKLAGLDEQKNALRKLLAEKRLAELKGRFEIVRKKAEDKDRLEESAGEAGQLLDELQKYRNELPAEAEKLLGQVKALHDQLSLNLQDEQAWKEVEEASKRNPKAYDDIAQKAKEYLERFERGEHRRSAENLIRDSLRERWKELYKAFYERATIVENRRTFDDARNRAEEALRWVADKKALFGNHMPFLDKLRSLEEWQQWANVLGKGYHTLNVTVDPRAVGRKVWLRCELDGQQIGQDTRWFGEKKTYIFSPLSAESLLDGKRLRITVTVDSWFLASNVPFSYEREGLALLCKEGGRFELDAEGYGNPPPKIVVQVELNGNPVPRLPSP